MTKITIDHEWNEYLRLSNINTADYSAKELKAMKRAFYGGFERFIGIMRDNFSDTDEGVRIMEDIHNEVVNFQLKEKGQMN